MGFTSAYNFILDVQELAPSDHYDMKQTRLISVHCFDDTEAINL